MAHTCYRRDLLADWDDFASPSCASPSLVCAAPVAMDVDGARPPAAAAQACGRGAVPACGHGQDAAGKSAPPWACDTAAEDCRATRRGLARRGSTGVVEGAGALRHASRSPPKKMPRWRGRSRSAGAVRGGAARVDISTGQPASSLRPRPEWPIVERLGLSAWACAPSSARRDELASGAGGACGRAGNAGAAGASGVAGGAPMGALASPVSAGGKAHAAVALLRFQVEQGCIAEVRARSL